MDDQVNNLVVQFGGMGKPLSALGFIKQVELFSEQDALRYAAFCITWSHRTGRLNKDAIQALEKLSEKSAARLVLDVKEEGLVIGRVPAYLNKRYAPVPGSSNALRR